MPPGYDTRQASLRCVDCLRDNLASHDTEEPLPMTKDACYMMSGDTLCSTHAQERMKLGGWV
jgi:hypothetical protein